MSLKPKKALIAVLLLSIFIPIGIVKIYEPVSTGNKAINLLKRFASDCGVFVVNIYDPYKNTKKAERLRRTIFSLGNSKKRNRRKTDPRKKRRTPNF